MSDWEEGDSGRSEMDRSHVVPGQWWSLLSSLPGKNELVLDERKINLKIVW